MDVTLCKPDHALGFTVMGTRITPIATGDDTGHWELFTLDLAPGARSPLHTLAADKVFVVTAGSVRLTVDDRVEDLAAGGHALIPAGTAHNYANPTDAPATMVGFISGPAAQIEFLRGMSVLTSDGPPDPAALAAHTARHGVRLVPAG